MFFHRRTALKYTLSVRPGESEREREREREGREREIVYSMSSI